MNQVVAHTKDGTLLKGITNDFLPTKERFHIVSSNALITDKPQEVVVSELKAVFFVKDLNGNPGRHRAIRAFDASQPMPGRKVRVVFHDGETLLGTTQGYQAGRPGFFVVPADMDSNNERCFVVSTAAKEITML